jgi:hypothetical protein
MIVKHLSFILLFSVCSTTLALGQQKPEKLCNQISNSIVQPLIPVKIYRQNVYVNECIFEFTISEKEKLHIAVEIYKTKKESHKSLKSDLNSFLAYNNVEEKPKFTKINLNLKDYWDEVYFYKSNVRDNILLLRKRNYNVVMIATNHEILEQLESSFRKIRFDK